MVPTWLWQPSSGPLGIYNLGVHIFLFDLASSDDALLLCEFCMTLFSDLCFGDKVGTRVLTWRPPWFIGDPHLFLKPLSKKIYGTHDGRSCILHPSRHFFKWWKALVYTSGQVVWQTLVQDFFDLTRLACNPYCMHMSSLTWRHVISLGLTLDFTQVHIQHMLAAFNQFTFF